MKRQRIGRSRSPSPFGSLFGTQESSDRDERQEVSFFLGAGASIAAGVPDTLRFVTEFLESLDDHTQRSVRWILDVLGTWASKRNPPRVVDIELLLEALQRLADKDQDVLPPFFSSAEIQQLDFDPRVLLRALRDYIRTRVIVSAEAIRYLDPLRGFIQEFRPLDIFSANYDTCVEQFCSVHKLEYRDGFTEAWQPRVFDDPGVEIRLFKLHGSATWYRSDRGRYLKLPVLTTGSSIELITKEHAESLMLYPAQKFEYVEPLFELLLNMKRRLARCRTLFVVGYSFRDDHIRGILWDVARENRELQVVLIGPAARLIYERRLRAYDGGTESSLSGRVICLPYLFERVLPSLRRAVFAPLRGGRECIKRQIDAEILGHEVRWAECLFITATGGDLEGLTTVLDRITVTDDDIHRNMVESLALGLVQAAGAGDGATLSSFSQRIYAAVLFLLNRADMRVLQGTSELGDASRNLPELARRFDQSLTTAEARQEWMKESAPLKVVLAVLGELRSFLRPWIQGNVQIDAYLESRPSMPSELRENLAAIKGRSNTILGGIDRQPIIAKLVLDLERAGLDELLKPLATRLEVSLGS